MRLLKKSYVLLATLSTALAESIHNQHHRRSTFQHPGLLHTADDFARISNKVASRTQPWYTGWEKLINNSHSQATYTPNPQPTIYRGSDGTHAENYGILYNDIAAAYQNALRWKIAGDTSHADTAVNILDSWASTLVQLGGSSDKFLAAGIYGYQFANVAEIMRDYSGWPDGKFKAFVEMLQSVFWYWSSLFLFGDQDHASHNGAAIDHYWANWDLCNIASGLSLGILADNQTMFNQVIDYFITSGGGNGNIKKALWKVYDNVDGENLAQYQESGRDQGHTLLGIGQLGVIAQTGYNQGHDLFSLLSSRILAGSEYVTKYNIGYDVPYTTYDNSDHVNQTVISSTSRGSIVPVFELLYNHYGKVEHLNVTYTERYKDKVVAASGGAEGGGGDYSPNSGGFDFLGFGTLMFSQ